MKPLEADYSEAQHRSDVAMFTSLIAQLVLPLDEPCNADPTKKVPPRPKALGEQFEWELTYRPNILSELTRYAKALFERGHRKYSIKTIVEVVRWSHHMRKGPGDKFLLNNSLVSRYARKIMQDNPELLGFFELRELRS